MTPRELSVARDLVARARLNVEQERRRHQRWTTEREAAGEAALAALHKAEAKARKKQLRTEDPPAPPTLRLRCVYCGQGVRLRDQSKNPRIPATCSEHRDLPAVDPFYGGGIG